MGRVCLILVTLAFVLGAFASRALAEAPTQIAGQRCHATACPLSDDRITNGQPVQGAVSASCEGTAAPTRRTTIAGFVSYGFAREINGSKQIDIGTLGIRWSRVYNLAGPTSLGGHPGFEIELLPFMSFDQQPRAYAGGFNLLYAHRFALAAGVQPVIRLGAGFLYANKHVPPGETRHNFSLVAGAGVDVRIGSARWLLLEYRLHHVSNANAGIGNPGINAHTAFIGIAFEIL